jgi:hypothetical protein
MAQPSEPPDGQDVPPDDRASCDDVASPAAYANHFEIGYNAFEFLLDFVHVYDEGATTGARIRVVTVPAYAKAFSDLLQSSVAAYEETFGPLAMPSPEAEDADCEAGPD